ncbi:hypothetical protein K466DRAFT_589212 [Polyporus arcularius HHB13444]|uniref:4a-hydroxytetrahydrobiopterin dehydratase n=1 Tax=Polyporus arcularius HHB13444 TaxID=1314778 RepID=A0A5C3PE04_9APHY|nr:hypothetical protein K466DRAFT_589212 [Polyporus arcularius HHB13444]
MTTTTGNSNSAGNLDGASNPPGKLLKPPPYFPELPPAPRYPCPFLTEEEINTYLTPLYRRSWTVQPSSHGPTKKAAPELVKRFDFSSGSQVGEFLERVGWVQESENHHETREVNESSVTIRVHTHSGLRPASHPEEPRKRRVCPGITLRDVRFAYLLEGAAEGCGCVQSRGRYGMLPEEQPRSAEAVEARRHHNKK